MKLKPCPFCGGKAYAEATPPFGKCMQVSCLVCRATIMRYETGEINGTVLAKYAWNKRTDEFNSEKRNKDWHNPKEMKSMGMTPWVKGGTKKAEKLLNSN